MRHYNISVVGLSGSEKDRGQVGVGKSCLCNRFIRPMADDYNIDHISVLSQSDFSGRIVNNDHFLYWGEVHKTTEDGVEYRFQVIEQTEFVDDSTFQPFKVGKQESYLKRCVAPKVYSAEKLMYICKNQLGIEKEYEQKVMPDGRLNIDGFVVVFDVSPVPNRPIDKQVDFVHTVILTVLKMKKPFVLVTTKNDDASDVLVREAEKICQRKEYKGLVNLIETSSHECINVDLAFVLLAQIIDKSKNRVKITSYQEAVKSRKELLDIRSEAVTKLIRSKITNHNVLWSQGSKVLSQYREWIEFLNVFGQDAGQKLFRRHMKKLRDEYLGRRLQYYVSKFSRALEYLLPHANIPSLYNESSWENAKNYIRNHEEFYNYFFDCPYGSWTEFIDADDTEDETRIPFDALETSEMETAFRNYVNSAQQDKKKNEWKQQFKALLEESVFVTPGKPLSEIRVLFMGHECFQALSEHDCQQIYDIHQNEIIESSKKNFVELMLENNELFQQLKRIDMVTQDNLRQITDALQDDFRYKALDRFDKERRTLLFQHLGFIRFPIRDHCPFFDHCVDNVIEDALEEKAAKGSDHMLNKWKTPSFGRALNLLIVGAEHLASDLLNDIRICTGAQGEYLYENQTYYLSYQITNGDMEAFKSIDIYSSGLVCVYSDLQSFETLKSNLERTLLCNLELEEKFENLPIVLVYQPRDLKEIDVDYLRNEGLRLSELLHCDFIDQNQNQQNYVYDILNIIIISLSITEMKSADQTNGNDIDLRILICMFCGDKYRIENILNPLMLDSTCVKPLEHSVITNAFVGDSKKCIELIFSSFHGVHQYSADKLIHGYVFFYSTRRRSSLVNLNILANQCSNMPVQIVAITENGGANAFFHSETSQLLITEGNSLADRLKSNFLTFSDDQFIKFAYYNPFLKNVWENKFEVESLNADECNTVDSGEGTLDNSVNHHLARPHPPVESYILSNTLGTDGSGSENYEMLPTRSLNSLNEERDLSLDEVFDDANERTVNYQRFQIFPPPTTPPEPAPPDNQFTSYKGQLISASESSLEEVTSDISGSKDSLAFHDTEWLDDPKKVARNFNKNPIWNNFSGSSHAHTTGRRQIDPNLNKIRPKGPSQTLKMPGKLNLNNFQIVSDAVAKMNISSDPLLPSLAGVNDVNRKSKRFVKYDEAILNDDNESDEPVEYEQIYENEDCTESDSCTSSTEKNALKSGGHLSESNATQNNRKLKKKKCAIPVQTPKVPNYPCYVSPPEIPHDYQKMTLKESLETRNYEDAYFYGMDKKEDAYNLPRSGNFSEFGKSAISSKESEKSERRRIKEENARLRKIQEKEREQEKKMQRKMKQNSKPSRAGGADSEQVTKLAHSINDDVPVFLKYCVEYIEKEGLALEGIYRVPGSRAHVDTLFQKFDEDLTTDIDALDVPVNAIATALKDFFSKHLPPLFNKEISKELEEIACSRNTSSKSNMEIKSDKSCRLIALKSLLQKLPPKNFNILKYIFQHFVNVSENAKFNSMDSKNLAICWWPTLIPIDFTDMGHFEQLRPFLEDMVQMMIDQYPYLFCGKDAFVMV